MNTTIASAPGKVVLAGEYAVLDGAPAICMAVDRRARATVEAHDQNWHRVVAPGFTSTEGRFVTPAGGIEWLAGGDSYPLFEQLWREVGAAPTEHTSYTLDTEDFLDVESGTKIGIGSSAALAVALATSLCATIAPNIDAGQVARVAHRKFQGNAGSGVDVACSLLGGLIEYRMDREEQTQLDWPDGLAFALLWSGVPSSTAEKLRRLEINGAQRSRFDLGEAAERMAIAWSSGSVRQILDGYQTYTDTLRVFSIDHDLGIFDAGHGALVDAAKEMGLTYKPCGAGGGDVGVVLGGDEAAIAAFVVSPVVSGFVQLDAAVDFCGAQIVRDRH